MSICTCLANPRALRTHVFFRFLGPKTILHGALGCFEPQGKAASSRWMLGDLEDLDYVLFFWTCPHLGFFSLMYESFCRLMSDSSRMKQRHTSRFSWYSCLSLDSCVLETLDFRRHPFRDG